MANSAFPSVSPHLEEDRDSLLPFQVEMALPFPGRAERPGMCMSSLTDLATPCASPLHTCAPAPETSGPAALCRQAHGSPRRESAQVSPFLSKQIRFLSPPSKSRSARALSPPGDFDGALLPPPHPASFFDAFPFAAQRDRERSRNLSPSGPPGGSAGSRNAQPCASDGPETRRGVLDSPAALHTGSGCEGGCAGEQTRLVCIARAPGRSPADPTLSDGPEKASTVGEGVGQKRETGLSLETAQGRSSWTRILYSSDELPETPSVAAVPGDFQRGLGDGSAPFSLMKRTLPVLAGAQTRTEDPVAFPRTACSDAQGCLDLGLLPQAMSSVVTDLCVDKGPRTLRSPLFSVYTVPESLRGNAQRRSTNPHHDASQTRPAAFSPSGTSSQLAAQPNARHPSEDRPASHAGASVDAPGRNLKGGMELAVGDGGNVAVDTPSYKGDPVLSFSGSPGSASPGLASIPPHTAQPSPLPSASLPTPPKPLGQGFPILHRALLPSASAQAQPAGENRRAAGDGLRGSPHAQSLAGNLSVAKDPCEASARPQPDLEATAWSRSPEGGQQAVPVSPSPAVSPVYVTSGAFAQVTLPKAPDGPDAHEKAGAPAFSPRGTDTPACVPAATADPQTAAGSGVCTVPEAGERGAGGRLRAQGLGHAAAGMRLDQGEMEVEDPEPSPTAPGGARASRRRQTGRVGAHLQTREEGGEDKGDDCDVTRERKRGRPRKSSRRPVDSPAEADERETKSVDDPANPGPVPSLETLLPNAGRPGFPDRGPTLAFGIPAGSPPSKSGQRPAPMPALSSRMAPGEEQEARLLSGPARCPAPASARPDASLPAVPYLLATRSTADRRTEEQSCAGHGAELSPPACQSPSCGSAGRLSREKRSGPDEGQGDCAASSVARLPGCGHDASDSRKRAKAESADAGADAPTASRACERRREDDRATAQTRGMPLNANRVEEAAARGRTAEAEATTALPDGAAGRRTREEAHDSRAGEGQRAARNEGAERQDTGVSPWASLQACGVRASLEAAGQGETGAGVETRLAGAPRIGEKEPRLMPSGPGAFSEEGDACMDLFANGEGESRVATRLPGWNVCTCAAQTGQAAGEGFETALLAQSELAHTSREHEGRFSVSAATLVSHLPALHAEAAERAAVELRDAQMLSLSDAFSDSGIPPSRVTGNRLGSSDACGPAGSSGSVENSAKTEVGPERKGDGEKMDRGEQAGGVSSPVSSSPGNAFRCLQRSADSPGAHSSATLPTVLGAVRSSPSRLPPSPTHCSLLETAAPGASAAPWASPMLPPWACDASGDSPHARSGGSEETDFEDSQEQEPERGCGLLGGAPSSLGDSSRRLSPESGKCRELPASAAETGDAPCPSRKRRACVQREDHGSRAVRRRSGKREARPDGGRSSQTGHQHGGDASLASEVTAGRLVLGELDEAQSNCDSPTEEAPTGCADARCCDVVSQPRLMHVAQEPVAECPSTASLLCRHPACALSSDGDGSAHGGVLERDRLGNRREERSRHRGSVGTSSRTRVASLTGSRESCRGAASGTEEETPSCSDSGAPGDSDPATRDRGDSASVEGATALSSLPASGRHRKTKLADCEGDTRVKRRGITLRSGGMASEAQPEDGSVGAAGIAATGESRLREGDRELQMSMDACTWSPDASVFGKLTALPCVPRCLEGATPSPTFQCAQGLAQSGTAELGDRPGPTGEAAAAAFVGCLVDGAAEGAREKSPSSAGSPFATASVEPSTADCTPVGRDPLELGTETQSVKALEELSRSVGTREPGPDSGGGRSKSPASRAASPGVRQSPDCVAKSGETPAARHVAASLPCLPSPSSAWPGPGDPETGEDEGAQRLKASDLEPVPPRPGSLGPRAAGPQPVSGGACYPSALCCLPRSAAVFMGANGTPALNSQASPFLGVDRETNAVQGACTWVHRDEGKHARDLPSLESMETTAGSGSEEPKAAEGRPVAGLPGVFPTGCEAYTPPQELDTTPRAGYGSERVQNGAASVDGTGLGGQFAVPVESESPWHPTSWSWAGDRYCPAAVQSPSQPWGTEMGMKPGVRTLEPSRDVAPAERESGNAASCNVTPENWASLGAAPAPLLSQQSVPSPGEAVGLCDQDPAGLRAAPPTLGCTSLDPTVCGAQRDMAFAPSSPAAPDAPWPNGSAHRAFPYLPHCVGGPPGTPLLRTSPVPCGLAGGSSAFECAVSYQVQETPLARSPETEDYQELSLEATRGPNLFTPVSVPVPGPGEAASKAPPTAFAGATLASAGRPGREGGKTLERKAEPAENARGAGPEDRESMLDLSDARWRDLKRQGYFRLGDKGRTSIKSRIARELRANPELRAQAAAVSGVRSATTKQLYQLAELCGFYDVLPPQFQPPSRPLSDALHGGVSEASQQATAGYSVPPLHAASHQDGLQRLHGSPMHQSLDRVQPAAFPESRLSERSEEALVPLWPSFPSGHGPLHGAVEAHGLQAGGDGREAHATGDGSVPERYFRCLGSVGPTHSLPVDERGEGYAYPSGYGDAQFPTEDREETQAWRLHPREDCLAGLAAGSCHGDEGKEHVGVDGNSLGFPAERFCSSQPRVGEPSRPTDLLRPSRPFQSPAAGTMRLSVSPSLGLPSPRNSGAPRCLEASVSAGVGTQCLSPLSETSLCSTTYSSCLSRATSRSSLGRRAG
uniref:AT hook motif-containing protein, putative n=1 Tax=Neospora caninum (strain Liverpool) TaxID=572307 RepID=A0A0F7UDR7_NEOCL|nr:TPA: AT hook motif-containing protein, putative [Neospora caninum Liverpool]